MRRPALLGLLVAAVALGSWSWTAALEFQIDDYVLLPEAGPALASTGRLLATPSRLLDPDDAPLADRDSPLFQPVLWTSFALEAALSGIPLHPGLFHVVSAVVHALAAGALFVLLRRWVPVAAAVAGTLFFAWHPGGAQAITWIAARGLVLVGLFGVLALLAIRRSARTAHARDVLVAGLALALAFLSQIAAVTLVPVALVALGLAHRRTGARRIAWLALVLLLPPIVAWLLRARVVGTFSLAYLGGTSAGLSALPRMLEALPRFVLDAMAPWNRDPAIQDLQPLLMAGGVPRVLLLGPWLVLAATAIVAQPRRAFRLLGLWALATAVLAAPALFLWSMWPGLEDGRTSRALYPAMVALAALFAILLGLGAGTPGGRRWLRIASIAAAGLVIVASVDALIHVARIELRARDKIARRQRGLVEAAEALGTTGVLHALDREELFAGVPLVAARHLGRAVREPFQLPGVPVAGRSDLEELLVSGDLTTSIAPLRVVAWSDERFAPLGPVLPALPSRWPALVPSPSPGGGALAWKPKEPFPPRFAAALRIPRRSKPESPDRVAILLRTEGEPLYYELEALAKDVVIGLDLVPQWVLAGEVREVIVRAGSADPVLAPEILRELPSLPVPRSPARGERLRAGDPVELELRGIVPGSVVRLRFVFVVGDARFSMVYRSRADDLEGTGDLRTWRPRPADREGAVLPELAWHRIAELFEERLRPYGLDEVMVRWRVELFDPSGQVSFARSPWTELRLAI